MAPAKSMLSVFVKTRMVQGKQAIPHQVFAIQPQTRTHRSQGPQTRQQAEGHHHLVGKGPLAPFPVRLLAVLAVASSVFSLFSGLSATFHLQGIQTRTQIPQQGIQ